MRRGTASVEIESSCTRVYHLGMDSPENRRGSEVLDAILDKVVQDPVQQIPASTMFRAQALAQLEIAHEVDTRLSLVSRRNWLALLGVGLLVAAFTLWAALTPSVSSVAASGRVIATPGASTLSATSPGVVLTVAPAGTVVTEGSAVATLRGAAGTEDIVSAVAGTVWQVQALPGSTVSLGQPVVSLLPPGSADQILLVLPESQAAGIAAGMTVQVTALGMTSATVDSVSAPMSAQLVSERVGLVKDPDTTYVTVSARLAAALPPGAAVSATIVRSEGTVLTRLLGRT